MQWLNDPVTLALRQWAESKREKLKEQWAHGEFSDVFEHATALKMACAQGAASIYKELMELDFDQLMGEIADETESRAGAAPGDDQP